MSLAVMSIIKLALDITSFDISVKSDSPNQLPKIKVGWEIPQPTEVKPLIG
ncbi:hypothetical protein [Arthrospira platensis]|uniref:hypothetical protein n=1 Tax=Limnospira platensis TaxID=118562 RepID=UPI0002FB4685|nr:hypothetical protein [Arthrospira platensis]MBD2669955.1 hypothetical protein [Arthrospira platensis FACHB-439]MBD2710534.1 hypothetical protein [Arthrospira platensis FACHB-835]MDF2211465.1 hypothetical protein [Arthrospira platensis NCB002]MDT9295252.1 hypothetical protein [Arthrospira platensis PCC 7345]QQW29820.1 hypothetical protein AP9108_02955 [Arthrospira sp. PCC 9108]